MERKNNKQPKLHIKKGDTVKVIAGDDKGKSGKVLELFLERNRAIVEGINIPQAGNPRG
jgi:large subunit ribosomal protein L24